MACLDIVTYGDPILRSDCRDLTLPLSNSLDLIDDMFETMYRKVGIGLAAPQIGKDINLTVIDHSFGENEEDAICLINPEIIEKSQNMIESEEGCLSIPDIKSKIFRHEWVKVKYYDLKGNERIIEADGIKSIVLQHEIDHLRGILFIDHLKGLKKTMIMRKIRKSRSSNDQD